MDFSIQLSVRGEGCDCTGDKSEVVKYNLEYATFGKSNNEILVVARVPTFPLIFVLYIMHISWAVYFVYRRGFSLSDRDALCTAFFSRYYTYIQPATLAALIDVAMGKF